MDTRPAETAATEEVNPHSPLIENTALKPRAVSVLRATCCRPASVGVGVGRVNSAAPPLPISEIGGRDMPPALPLPCCGRAGMAGQLFFICCVGRLCILYFLATSNGQTIHREGSLSIRKLPVRPASCLLLVLDARCSHSSSPCPYLLVSAGAMPKALSSQCLYRGNMSRL